MKRFIDLSGQITEGTKEFAFFCTTTCRFFEFSGCQTWETVEEFMEDYDGNEIGRFTTLIPEGWPNNQHELEERPIPKGTTTIEHCIDISNDVEMIIHCDPCEGQLLDTKVEIGGKNLCWISYMDKDNFVRDLQAVISKYRI